MASLFNNILRVTSFFESYHSNYVMHEYFEVDRDFMSNTFIFHGFTNSNIIILAPCISHAHFLATDFHHRRETKVQRRLHKARACTWTCTCTCIGLCSCKCVRESCERRVQQLKRPRRHHQGNSYFSNVRLCTWVFH